MSSDRQIDWQCWEAAHSPPTSRTANPKTRAAARRQDAPARLNGLLHGVTSTVLAAALVAMPLADLVVPAPAHATKLEERRQLLAQTCVSFD